MRAWLTTFVCTAFLAFSIQPASAGDNNTDVRAFLSAQAATSSQTSGEISMKGYSAAGLQVSFAGGTPNGTITVQSSADGVSYDTMPGVAPIAVTTAVVQQIDITKTGWGFLKINWTNTSSTGGTTVSMNAVRKNY